MSDTVSDDFEKQVLAEAQMVAKAMTPLLRAQWNKARACWDSKTSDNTAFRVWWSQLGPGDRRALVVLSCSRAFDPAIAAQFND